MGVSSKDCSTIFIIRFASFRTHENFTYAWPLSSKIARSRQACQAPGRVINDVDDVAADFCAADEKPLPSHV